MPNPKTAADAKREYNEQIANYKAEVGKLRTVALDIGHQQIANHTGGKRELDRLDSLCGKLEEDAATFKKDFSPRTQSPAQSQRSVEKFQHSTEKHLQAAQKGSTSNPIVKCLKAIASCVMKIVSAAKNWMASAAKSISSLFKGKKENQLKEPLLAGGQRISRSR